MVADRPIMMGADAAAVVCGNAADGGGSFGGIGGPELPALLAKGLEWIIPSPPPTFNFDEIPVVTEEPYNYQTSEGH